MVKAKLKLKESLKNLKMEAAEKKAADIKKSKKEVEAEQDWSDVSEDEEKEDDESESEDNLESDAKKLIDQISGEYGSLSHKEQRKLKKALKNAYAEDDAKAEDEEEDDDDEDAPELFNTNKLMESDSEGEDEDLGNHNKDDDEEEEEEEDVPLSDVELDDDADVVPYQKVTVNNRKAMTQSLASFSLPHKDLKFSEHLSVTSSEPLVLRDVFDDLERELAFYKQGLAAVKVARAELTREKVSFTRPTDYFAEMVKSDEHMDKLKQKLIETETAKKASQDARRQRELKKFGKQVQHAKLQERAKDKRETLDKIKSLKRKRAGNEITNDDFDIAVEEAAADMSERRGGRGGRDGKPNARRQAKNSKYGSGGKKRFSRSNDAESSNDMSGFNSKRMKTGFGGSRGGAKAKRPGKSKRAGGKF